MEILIPTGIVFGLVIALMAIGVLLKRRPLEGSCGGIRRLTGECDVCEFKDRCERESEVE